VNIFGLFKKVTRETGGFFVNKEEEATGDTEKSEPRRDAKRRNGETKKRGNEEEKREDGIDGKYPYEAWYDG
jgi:hypothetical protein